MKIGFDLAQTSGAFAGCGWYAQALLEAMAAAAPGHEFLGYRHFGGWFNDPAQMAALPPGSNVRDPLAGCSIEEAMAVWRNDTAPGEPDLVHSTSFQAPRLRGSKLVFTVFDLSFWATPQFTTDQIRLTCQAGVLAALARADGLIFISEHARSEFERFIPNHHRRDAIATVVTPLASRWSATANPGDREGNYWLFVGSLEPRKNLEGLLTAYMDYAAGHPAPKPLWIVGGEGWRNDAIKSRLAPLERTGAVRRLGYVPEEKLRELYRDAFAFVFPSWYEGFGLPVLEAMTQGCPVISSTRTSLPEVGGNAAIYVDPAEPAQIARAMRDLEQDSGRRRELIARGRDQAARFSWENTAKQTLAFYDRILSAD